MPEIYRAQSGRQALFEIGVVGEDVNKILDHSVAEVILLLEEEAEREAEESLRVQEMCGILSLSFFSFSAADVIFFSHLPQSEPCVVSACADS